MSLRPLSFAAAAALMALLASTSSAQTAPAAPARPLGPTAFPTGPSAWIAPAGTSISIDPNSGRTSFALATQPIDGSSEQLARFADWRQHSYAGNGPYPATRAEPADFPKHTLYYPADLKKAPKLPVILWANGGCRNTSVEFTRFLGELASHGYIVAAIGRSDIPFEIINIGAPLGAGERSNDTRPRTNRESADMLAALDLLAKANGSRFQNKIDLTKVAALGQSCGGGMAFRAAKDARVKAVAALNSSFPTKTGGGIGGGQNADPAWVVEELKISAAIFNGGPADLAYTGGSNAFKAMTGAAPNILLDMPAMGHTGAYPMPDVRWTKAVLAWLDWSLKGDAKAKEMFGGANCGLCNNPDFWVKTKGVN